MDGSVDRRAKNERESRQLRDRKERKHYTDDWAVGDEEIDGKQTFNLEEKIETDRFGQCYVKEMNGAEFNLTYIQKHGFNTPLLFREKTGLGLRVPSPNFSVSDVRMGVGSRRILDVMDVNTQKNVEMTMKEWEKYYEDPFKDKLLNVISLEFSHTRLENYVQAPLVVRQIDWVERVWPRHLKEMQTESTNVLDDMMYPKVQKYCLMSVKGCYTDFHIDFGGTSVWYHILKGSKIFWLIPPTDKNLQLYENWVLSGKQGDVFFGDTVEKCGRVTLTEGQTFFIPTGWIHAVSTQKDSLVFGGNFLHSFCIEKQLKIAEVEDVTHVPQKFRYPFFTEMLWYVLERYVHCLLGRTHLKVPKDDSKLAESLESSETPVNSDVPFVKPPHVHLTAQELHGLKAIVMYLHNLPALKKNVPELISNPIALIRDVRDVVETHRNDVPELALTGKPVLRWADETDQDLCSPKKDKFATPRGLGHRGFHGGGRGRGRGGGTPKPLAPSGRGTPRRRRTRCKKCEACLRDDCAECTFCHDMIKFGGPGRMKQTCTMRQCLQPALPITATCSTCQLDGWGRTPSVPVQKPPADEDSLLMECSVCYEIIHAACAAKKYETNDTGNISEDLPNSWECPKCCRDGSNLDHRPRYNRSRPKQSDRRSSDASDTNSIADVKEIKSEHVDSETVIDESGHARPSSSQNNVKRKSSLTGDGSVMKRPKVEDENLPASTEYSSVNSVPETEIQQKHEMDASLQSKCKISHKKMKSSGAESDSSSHQTKKRRKSLGDLEDGNKFVARHRYTSGSHSDAEDNIASRYSLNQCVVQVRKLGLPLPKKLERPSSSNRVPFRVQLVNQLTAYSTKPLRKPIYPIRPAPLTSDDGLSEAMAANKTVLLCVFRYLTPRDLCACAVVCRAWNRCSIDPSLWQVMDLSRKRITAGTLTGIVRRQPARLVLDWTSLSNKQLGWLIPRLPQLRSLSLRGCPWLTVAALRTCYCPVLNILDVSFVHGLTDSNLHDLLVPPPDSRPGLSDSKSRLRNVADLRLAGCDLTDVALRYVVQHVQSLRKLDLSNCCKITDAGLAQLAIHPATTVETLTDIDLRGCHLLTDGCLEHLRRCVNLKLIDLRHSGQVSTGAIHRFASRHAAGSGGRWSVTDEKLLLRIVPAPRGT